MFGSYTSFAMATVNGDPKYKTYNNRYGFKKPDEPLKASGVDLTNGGGLEEFRQIQKYRSDYKIAVFDGLSRDRLYSVEIIFRPKKCVYNMVRTVVTIM